MSHRSTHEHRRRDRRHGYCRLTLTVLLAGLAAALLLGGCSSGSGNSGTGNAPTSPSTSASSPASTPALPAATTWTAQDASSAGSPGYLNSVAFVDAAHGWAVGESNDSNNDTTGSTIIATSDGGVTWQAQDASPAGRHADLEAVHFVDATHGWAVGGVSNGIITGNAVVLATTDGGATWRAQDASAAGHDAVLNSVDFVDSAHGWAVGVGGGSDYPPVILATSDGGASWKAQDASPAGRRVDLNAVHFVDPAHGWTVGLKMDSNGHAAGGVILVTSDGGVRWNAQDAGTANGLYGIAFSDSTHGWAVGYYGRGPCILATSDGGTTWEAQDASSAGRDASLNSVTFVDATHGWAAGSVWHKSASTDTPLILATSDGGATWKAQDASAGGSTGMVNEVCFLDAAHGWAVGTNPTGSGTYTPFILATNK